MNRNQKNKTVYRLSKALRTPVKELERLSKEQIIYINQYTGKSTFLEACPGSGKTEVIGLKGAYVISHWKNKMGGVAILTFTVSAAKELNNRVRKYADLTIGLYPHFIGTFDSWLHSYLLQPFSHYMTKYAGLNGDKSIRIIEENSDADFLFGFRQIITNGTTKLAVNATEYHYSSDWSTVHADSDSFQSALTKGLSTEDFIALKATKVKFLRAGFATYADAEMLSFQLLNGDTNLLHRVSKRFPVLIIDECQDLSDSQIAILNLLKSKGTTLHFVGDLNQSIYEFRKVDPRSIKGYIDSNGFAKLKLTNNYRSCQAIVNSCNNIIGNSTPITANVVSPVTPACVLWEYNDEAEFEALPSKFEDIVKAAKLDIYNSAIVARGKTTLKSFRSQSTNNKVSKSEMIALALTLYYKPHRKTEDLSAALYYFGKVISFLAYDGQGDSRNQYCPRDYFGPIEWRLLLQSLLKKTNRLYPFSKAGVLLTWSQWVAELKVFFSQNWSLLENRTKEYDKIKLKLKAPDNRGSNPVNDVPVTNPVHNVFRTTTIHSVKGETMDALLLVSNRTKHSQGGHYSHWLRDPGYEEEHIRFAYVACSRPKYLLIMATPKLSAAEKAKFQSLGFS